MSRLILLIALFMTLMLPGSFAQEQAFIDGSNDGQGFVFSVADKCWLVTARHVLTEAEISDPKRIQLTVITGGGRAIASAPDQSGWNDPGIDVVVLAVDTCKFANDKSVSPPLDDFFAFRNSNGTLIYFSVEAAGDRKGKWIIKPKGNSCPIKLTVSGSLVMLHNRIAGMLTNAAETACAGFVEPLDNIQDYLFKTFQFRLPLHPLAPALMDAAYIGDENKFSAFLEQVSDANITDASGNIALERVATTYNNYYYYLAIQGWKERKPVNACELWIQARVRMAKALLRKGAVVDGPPGPNWTPLSSAVIANSECDNTPMVQALIEAGADPSHMQIVQVQGATYSHSPLIQATDDGRPSTLAALLLSPKARANVATDSYSGQALTPLFALALTSAPSKNGTTVTFYDQNLDEDCWNGDNAKVAKFRMLLPVTDLSTRMSMRKDSLEEYSNMTVQEALEHRLGGGCAISDCDGQGRNGPGRCLERMLGALLKFKEEHGQ